MSDDTPYMRIFVAYASEDKKAAYTFLSHLESLEGEEKVSVWHNGLIKAGGIRKDVIRNELKKANIVLLLVSDIFLKSSDYKTIKNQLSKPHNSTIIPILLRTSKWENDTFLNQFEPLPTDRKPIIVRGKQKEAQEKDYENVVEAIGALLPKNTSTVVSKLEGKEQVQTPKKKRETKYLKVIGIIMTFLTVLGLIAGLNADLPPLVDRFKKIIFSQEEKIRRTNSSISHLGKPIFSKEDSLFKILIVRFEDNLNEDDNTYCVGRSIQENFINLEVNKKLPINSVYADSVASPTHPQDAELLQEYHNADVLIYGLANEIQENCTAANVCFRHVVANTVISNSPEFKEVKRVKHDSHYEKVSHSDIEEGKLSVDEYSIEAWVRGLVALKRNDREAYLAEIDRMVGDISNLTKEEQIDKYLNRGLAYDKLEEYDKAILDFDKVIELSPNYIGCYWYRGHAYEELKNYDKAIENYNKIIELEPNSSFNYGIRARFYESQKSYEKVVVDYGKAIELDSNDVSYYSDRGDTYIELKDYEKAIKDYSKAINLSPDYTWLYDNLADAYIKLKDYERVIVDYSKTIESEPDSASHYISRGIFYEKSKEYEKAILDISKSIELSPNEAWLYARRASIYGKLKKYGKAITDYSEAIELKSNHVLYYISRGGIYDELKEYRKAIADYSVAIKFKPNEAWYYIHRGGSYIGLRKYDKAIADYDKVIELKPDNSLYYDYRKNAYIRLKKYDEIIEDYNEMVDMQPNVDWHYIHRGDIYIELKEYDKAIADINRAIRLKPKETYYYVVLGNVYGDIEKYEEAIRTYDKAIEVDSNYVMAYNNRAFFQKNLKEFDKEMADYDKAIELKPEGAIYYVNRGVLYAHLKEYEKAVADCNSAINLEPYNAWNYVSRGDTYINMWKYGKAISDYNKATELDSSFYILKVHVYGRILLIFAVIFIAINLLQVYVYPSLKISIKYLHLLLRR